MSENGEGLRAYVRRLRARLEAERIATRELRARCAELEKELNAFRTMILARDDNSPRQAARPEVSCHA